MAVDADAEGKKIIDLITRIKKIGCITPNFKTSAIASLSKVMGRTRVTSTRNF